MASKIIKIISKEYTLLNENGIKVNAILSGNMKKGERLKLGDFVEYEENDSINVINKLLPRKNSLIRPNIANVDQALIMMSCKDPDFSYKLTDKLIMMIEYEEIEPVIVISKTDLDPLKANEIIANYSNMGFKILGNSKEELNPEILEVLKDKITVVCGASGVGKSTFLNSLDSNLNLKTQEISYALNKGKNTTTHHELYEVAGGLVADTPGFGSLYFKNMDTEYLSKSLSFIKPYISECKFLNCMHINEPECGLKKAVENGKVAMSMYSDYKEVIEEINRGKK